MFILRGSLFLTLSLSACAAEPSPGSDAQGVPAQAERRFALTGAFRLGESSAAAVSARHPGVFYTINDSGNDPVLYAFDTTGMARGRWVVRKAGSFDWEAVAVAPCQLTGGDSTRSCVYIGDVGDNGTERRTITLYRVVEPDSLTPGSVGEMHPDSLHVRYPDRPHNVEAMVVASDGGILLFTKERRVSRLGRAAYVYRIPPRTWAPTDTGMAELVDSIATGFAVGLRGGVTDASLDPLARLLVLRTYQQVHLFPADSSTGRPVAGAQPATCDIAFLGEPQGEGVGIAGRGDSTVRLVLTSEGRDTPSHLISCPLPGTHARD
jgi:hypothetical protein